jgi:hypothetical protein
MKLESHKEEKGGYLYSLSIVDGGMVNTIEL